MTTAAETQSTPDPSTKIASAIPGETPARARLALVDDDDDYREIISAELTDRGFAVTSFKDGPPLLEHFNAGNEADVIVLDWNLPSVVGVDLLPVLRNNGVETPVIILTGMSQSEYELKALDYGAVDFVDKSRGVSVLAKRAQLVASAARSPLAEDASKDDIELGHLVLRPRLCRAYWKGDDVALTVTEFNIVHRLARAAGEHVAYREIYDCVHHSGFIAGSGENGFRTNVRSSIKRIRNKFKALDQGFAEIENFPAFGYCWKKGAPPAQ